MNHVVTVHESFARFTERPDRETFRNLLRGHVGELRQCDFKEAWPTNSALAKHVLAIANSGGGCLVVGVAERNDGTLDPIGMEALTDKADLTSGVKIYLPPQLNDAIEIADFAYNASDWETLNGKKFQVMVIHPNTPSVPFVAMRGGEGVRAGAIYIRREGATEEALYDDVQRLLKARMSAEPKSVEARSLNDHLEELKVLYNHIPKTVIDPAAPVKYEPGEVGKLFVQLAQSMSKFAPAHMPNPHLPDELYDQFVRRMLDTKKMVIERLIGG
jgi:hypothetical protein